MGLIFFLTRILYCISVLGYTRDEISNSKTIDVSSQRPTTVGDVDTIDTIGTEITRGPIFSNIQYNHPSQKNRARITTNWLERTALEYSQNILAINVFGFIGLYLLSAGFHRDRPQYERIPQTIHYDQVDIEGLTNEHALDDTEIHAIVTAEATELPIPTGITTIHFGIILYHHEDLPYMQTTWQHSELANMETLLRMLRAQAWFREIQESYLRYNMLNNQNSDLELFEPTENVAQNLVKIGALDNVPNIVRSNTERYRTELRILFQNLMENGSLKSQFQKLEGQTGNHGQDSQTGNHIQDSQTENHAQDNQTIEELESCYGDMLRDECIQEIKKLVTSLTADHFAMDIPLTQDGIRVAMQTCRVAKQRIAEGEMRDAAEKFDRQITNIMEDVLKDKTIPSFMRIALMSRKTQRRVIYLISIHDSWTESSLKLQQYLKMNAYQSKLGKQYGQRNISNSNERIYITRAEYESWYTEYYHQTDVDKTESELRNDILGEFCAHYSETDASSFSQTVGQLKSCIFDALKEQRIRRKREQMDPKITPDRAFINMMITEIGSSLLLKTTPLLVHIGKNPQLLAKCILRSFKLFEKHAEELELLEMENSTRSEGI